MADYLQREFSLPVIRVVTTQRKSGALVSVTALLNRNGQRSEVGSVEVPLARFGYRAHGSPDLAVPREIIDMLAALDREGTWPQASPEWEAWLHLGKPYGTLGAVPWERDLTEPLGRPIARLPDVLPVPRPPHERFNVAILAAAPRVGPAGIARIADILAKGVGPSLRVSIVSTTEQRGAVAAELEGSAIDHEIVLLPTSRTAGSVLDRTAQALAGRPLDAVHFVMRAVSIGSQGVLVPEKLPGPSALTTSDVSSFLTSMGAGIAGFSRPPGHWSDFGLRLLVDELGSTRAGPVVLHDQRGDRDGSGLAGAYSVLAAPATDRLVASRGVSIYLQPAMLETDYYSTRRVTDNTWLPAQGAMSAPPESSDLYGATPASPESPASPADPAEPPAEMPQWVAAAQQFFDQKNTDLARFESASSARDVTDVEKARFAGIKRGLADAEEILKRYSRGVDQ
ncbi:hypothetical protein [Microbacterium sp. SS28]|uniref:hypothetical protein n=1 Tax=Microbacterium sp. SS28 TaxID=2919948 RepID=UPI001FAAD385|nr:hypothetical protein [Microbacterium sp. SS28]